MHIHRLFLQNLIFCTQWQLHDFQTTKTYIMYFKAYSNNAFHFDVLKGESRNKLYEGLLRRDHYSLQYRWPALLNLLYDLGPDLRICRFLATAVLLLWTITLKMMLDKIEWRHEYWSCSVLIVRATFYEGIVPPLEFNRVRTLRDIPKLYCFIIRCCRCQMLELDYKHKCRRDYGLLSTKYETGIR